MESRDFGESDWSNSKEENTFCYDESLGRLNVKRSILIQS